jgi:hypothetical protein
MCANDHKHKAGVQYGHRRLQYLFSGAGRGEQGNALTNLRLMLSQ